MSRIFDALQRSTSDGESYDFPLISSLAAEVPQAAELTDAMEEQAKDIAATETAQFLPLTISPSSNSRLVCLTDQASLGAEKFRFLGVRLRQLKQTRALTTLLITSTIPEEGKSLVSANLAIALAQRKQKVLLVDGDLRRPSLSERFGIPKRLPGLSEWFQSGQGTITSIYQLEEVGFFFLPSGGPFETNLDLIQPERLAQLMNQLTDRFDWVLIDSPPGVPLAGTSGWMRFGD